MAVNKKLNFFNYIFSILATIALLFLVVYICNNRYEQASFNTVCFLVLGAILSGFLVTALHELGHLIFGLRNNFSLLSICIWFFKWEKIGKKFVFSFTMIGEQAGYTEMVPICEENMRKRYMWMSIGGSIFSLIFILLGLPVFFIKGVPIEIFAIFSMFLPIGAYTFLGNALPMITSGVRNDGAVFLDLIKQNNSSKVMLNLLKIQSHLFEGKTPAEIDEKLYFDLPQLQEDDIYFLLLLNARYYYYLDKKDFENAKKVTDRSLSLLDYIPKSVIYPIKADALYNACTFDKNEEFADEMMYELEKYLNNVNTATNVRIKLAYILSVRDEKEGADVFIKKAKKEAKRHKIKGLGRMELSLIEELELKI